MADASVGLALFDEARSRARGQAGWTRRQPAAQAIARSMEHKVLQGMTPEQQFKALRDIPEAADLQARRQEWAAGQLPQEYENRLVFIHAHTVIYALDAIGKTLDKLTEMSNLPGVAAARDGYRTALPDLVPVRDSAHHTEDRARGLDKKGHPLKLQPINNGMFNAAEGTALILSALNDDKLGYTTNDGHYGEIEVSINSVEAAQTAIQQTFDAFSWRGPAHTVPR
jgi:hypothetical protein